MAKPPGSIMSYAYPLEMRRASFCKDSRPETVVEEIKIQDIS